MNWVKVFFSPDGRIGRQTYWIGWLVLVAVHILLGWTGIAALVATYSWVVISVKRFHDMGKTGWLAAIPLVAWVVAIASIFPIAITAIAAGVSGASEGETIAAVLTAVGGAALMFLAAGVISIVFLIWQGVALGDPGENRYGPAPTPSL